MKRSDFSYDLPAGLIAQEPRVRGASRMMVVTPAPMAPELRHERFGSFPELLEPGDFLVLNDTKVFPARLFAEPKGSMKHPIEVLLTRRLAPLMWEAWCKPARRIRPGDELRFSQALTARVASKRPDGTLTLQLNLTDQLNASDDAPSEEAFWSSIEGIGSPPLPPYIRRERPLDEDRAAYQTVYADKRGAIAAPTAGLHFTPEILERIAARGVEIVRITLHVGIGTFKPIAVEDIAEHRMDSEEYEISRQASEQLNEAVSEGRRIVAVGTTTVRTLESAIRLGDGRFMPGPGSTSLFITPGFRFQVAGALLTNFHLPESTLLMLVSAFAGIEPVRTAYAEAIRNHYMFYSYGDCMFITRPSLEAR